MNVILALTGMGAVAALLLDHGGFKLSALHERLVDALELAVVVIFVIDRVIRCLAARKRLAYLRENWLDFALIAGAIVATVIVATNARGSILSALTFYVLVAQIYIAGVLVLHAVNLNMRLANSGVPPAWMLVGSFAALSLVGSGLLMLPAATPDFGDSHFTRMDYVDSLFTSVSATCVTGLVVRDTGTEYTLFGQIVILALIQLGGLGMMLFGTALAMAVGKSLTLRSSAAVGEMMAVDNVGQVRRMMRFVVLTTFLLEALGALLLFDMFAAVQGDTSLSTGQAIWQSVFHSISSFCNAGFSLYGQNMMAGVQGRWAQPFREHWQVMGVMAPLIILGGLGFPVLNELCGNTWQRLRRLVGRWRPKIGVGRNLAARPLSLHAKLVLTSSLVLLLGGAAGLLLIGRGPAHDAAIGRNSVRTDYTAEPNDWESLSAGERVREAAFQSVTARTAGFNTINVSELSQAGKLWLCSLMTIGGSPAGTAGGIKTVTIAVLVLAAVTALRRRQELEAFRRRLAAQMLQRAAAVGVLYMGLLATVTLLLCVVMEESFAVIDLLFEACSACGTVGLSTGVTGSLTDAGKCVIVCGMFVGRLGPLTLLLAMPGRQRHVKYTYPAEGVVIG